MIHLAFILPVSLWMHTVRNNKSYFYVKIFIMTKISRRVTCPSAIITKTWYWPPLCSTTVMAISIIGANDVGPVTRKINKKKENVTRVL